MAAMITATLTPSIHNIMANHPNRSRAKSPANNPTDKKENRGGKRYGAGRKSEGKVPVCYKLAPDVVKFLRNNDRPASRLIEDAVRNYYLLTKNIS